MHQLFDDYEIRDVLNDYKTYGISDSQYEILYQFYVAIDQFSSEKMSWSQFVDPLDVLTDPKWINIQYMAKKVLKAFD